LRDRRAPLAMLVLAAAYLGLFAEAGAMGGQLVVDGTPMPLDPWLRSLFAINAMLLWWRLVVRMVFTGRAYGWREALWSLPRFVIGNFVTLAAAPRALFRYIWVLRGRPAVWDKTRHHFPDLSADA
jgi:adsorption protein B